KQARLFDALIQTVPVVCLKLVLQEADETRIRAWLLAYGPHIELIDELVKALKLIMTDFEAAKDYAHRLGAGLGTGVFRVGRPISLTLFEELPTGPPDDDLARALVERARQEKGKLADLLEIVASSRPPF
ncbi:MAG: hypothetical protein HN348_27080, partial [Proteobacteria bacterium]|nr:hypothetical protein [Pseudomonadota bacterium]